MPGRLRTSTPSMTLRILLRWHRALGLPQQPKYWYRDRLREETLERRRAETRWAHLSETADIFYILSRARHDGYPLCPLPPFSYKHVAVYAYMLPKYTLRWAFYRIAAALCRHGDVSSVSEVVNPSKDGKLQEVACRHGIEPTNFLRVCRSLRLVWPLLP